MSVIVENSDGEIEIFVKGADSVVAKRLREDEKEFMKTYDEALTNYGSVGLRTL